MKNDPINYKSILDLFNSLLGEYLPEVKSLSYKRKEMIRNIIRIHSPDKIREAFEQTLRSPFLLGMNDKGWKCSFDWILHGSNFIKVLEGNYLATRNRTLFDHPSTERLNNKTYERF
ncbi:MAG: hypothetical protein LUD15_09995 [Bacteroides sp.]|nr:hypothetical protein [Bacteroides sp.]